MLVSSVHVCVHICTCDLDVDLFYFVLGNLPPALRSKLGHIKLVAITKSSVVKNYGANAILKPVVEDVKKLVRQCITSSQKQAFNPLGPIAPIGAPVK